MGDGMIEQHCFSYTIPLWQIEQEATGKWLVKRCSSSGGMEIINDRFEHQSVAQMLADMMNDELKASYGRVIRERLEKRLGFRAGA